ncbi:MAG TPA: hypothetical protein VGU64_05090 [Terriglobales bacterium]|nr:hypothetical protein [Terriglobales bacterium]
MRPAANQLVPRRSRIAPRTNFSYGWVPDLPDHIDFLYTPHGKLLRALPSRVHIASVLSRR